MCIVSRDVISLALDPCEWFDGALEAILGDSPGPDPRLQRWEAQERARLTVIKGLLMADMQNASDAVIQALRNSDHHPHVQAWAEEEWFRPGRVAKRSRDIGQHVRSPEEVAALAQATVQPPYETPAVIALLEQGARMEVLRRAARRQSVPKLRTLLASRIKRFCQCACKEAEFPDFYEAGKTLKRRLQRGITDQDLRDIINTHLARLYDDGIEHGGRPGLVQVMVTDGIFSLDDGGARSAWHELVDLIQHGVALERFQVCRKCEELFYAPRKDQTFCSADLCQRARNNRNQRKSRGRKSKG